MSFKKNGKTHQIDELSGVFQQGGRENDDCVGVVSDLEFGEIIFIHFSNRAILPIS